MIFVVTNFEKATRKGRRDVGMVGESWRDDVEEARMKARERSNERSSVVTRQFSCEGRGSSVDRSS